MKQESYKHVKTKKSKFEQAAKDFEGELDEYI